MSIPENSGLTEEMPAQMNLEGVVNGHAFSMEGIGGGNILTGIQKLDIRVIEGDPLPFSFDILSVAFQYGNRTYTSYPAKIPDYFVQSFPEGFTFERTLSFEDGAIVKVESDISIEDGKFVGKIKYNGEGFPEDGPVMKKEVTKLEPGSESMYVSDGTLVGEVVLSYKTQSTHYTCHMKTIYRSKKPVENLPKFHYVHHRLEKKIVEEGYYYEQHETAIAKP
nr:green fluorescent protein [synthetic construct]